MAVNKKNLRVCEILFEEEFYQVIVAVAVLDEVDNILQEWALDKFSAVLDLPTALVSNKDITEVLTTLDIDNYAYLQSSVSAYMDMPRQVGMLTAPVLPTTLVSNLYVMPAGSAYLYSEAGFNGYFGEYTVPTASFTLSAGINYIGVMFNSGIPAYQIYSNISSFDFSSVFPVATVLNFGSEIFSIPFGSVGKGIPEKIVQMLFRRDKFSITDYTFTLTQTTRYVELSALTVSTGLNDVVCAAMDTGDADNDMYLFYKDSSQVWQNVKITQFDNAQYQSNSGLANLSAGEFVINYIYRVVCGDNLLMFNVLSNKFATLALAKESANITDLPDTIKNSAVLVGRIIIEQGSSSPAIQKVQNVTFGG